jgi:hypothetical protein
VYRNADFFGRIRFFYVDTGAEALHLSYQTGFGESAGDDGLLAGIQR